MAEDLGTRPIRVVVANTGPIVAAMLGECLEKVPQCLEQIHIPAVELQEWKDTLGWINQKLPADKRVDVPSLLGLWTQQGTLVLHELTSAQEKRAHEVTLRIHPDFVESGKLAVDGAAVVLARTLIDLGRAQALLADERRIRRYAMEEGIEIVGSIWLFRRLFEAGALDLDAAMDAPKLAQSRGQHYSPKLISEFSASLLQINEERSRSPGDRKM